MDEKGLLEILQLAKNNNEEAIYYLLKKFDLLIKKYARQLNYDCAETDLIICLLEFTKKVQLKKLETYSEGQLVNYIVNILRNKKIDIYRKRCLDIELVHMEEITEMKNNNQIDDHMNLQSLLNSLTDKQRDVIIAKYFQGYSDFEIGENLNISRQAVNKLKKRSLDKLREILMEDSYGKPNY
ncbi:RNA polymerase sigma factor [Clostridium aminobutyricum]|uniref:Sigma-70 family RNA polymerase sigma factor n=1 Tax=Clostridium aminobutyricum TaxID=33953 RepID=A0A939D6G1_CLOAM|nr:sigma-70 family RNA polymerase sigma factor [Clostridium aminobutyricum]MBN7771975.1 sigma-70 family RNA polymerase sigma factor [Clostridium aminobutyricum]